MDDSVEDPRVRISRLTAELDALAQPDDLPSMILSGNAVRRSEYLEAANQKQSELIAAYGEHAARLEGLVAAAIDIQSELTEILRMQSEMMPEGPRRAGAGGGSGGKKRSGQAAQRAGRQGAGKRAGAGSPRAASAAQPKRKGAGAGSPRAASAAQPKRKGAGAGSPRAASAAQPKRKGAGAGKKAGAGGRRGR